MEITRILQVVGHEFHRAMYAADRPDSRFTCVASSVALRNYLPMLGIPARIVSVHLAIYGRDAGGQLRSIELGAPDQTTMPDFKSTPGMWPGHMCVAVPGYLIDVTLYQARRPWHRFPKMVVVPVSTSDHREPLNGDLLAYQDFNGAEAEWRWHEDRADRLAEEAKVEPTRGLRAALRLLKATGYDIGDALERLKTLDSMQPGETLTFVFPEAGFCQRLTAVSGLA